MSTVRGVLAGIVGSEVVNGISDDELIFEHRIVDSLHLVELVERLESAFGVEVEGEELTAENFGSVGAIARFFASKAAA